MKENLKEILNSGLTWCVVGTGFLSVPASLMPIREVLTQYGFDPSIVALLCVGTATSLFAYGIGSKTWLSTHQRIERLEHNLIHKLRNHASRVSVLSYRGKLSRDQFDDALDCAIKDSANTIASLASIHANVRCGVEIQVYDPLGRHHYVAVDDLTEEAFRALPTKDWSPSTGIVAAMADDAHHDPIKVFSDLGKKQSEYEHSTVIDVDGRLKSVVVTPIQTRLRDLIRERHRDLFSDQPRYVAGFLTIHSEAKLDENSFEKDTLAKWADLLFLGLELFAISEIQQFGLEDSRIGRALRGLTNEGNVLDLRAESRDQKDRLTRPIKEEGDRPHAVGKGQKPKRK